MDFRDVKYRWVDVQNLVGISYRHPDTLSTFTANLDFSQAAAGLALAATVAHGTR